MRLNRIALAALVFLKSATIGEAVDAGGLEQGAVVSVDVSLAGFETPSQHWQDPCEDHGPFTGYYSGELSIPEYLDESTNINVWYGTFDPLHALSMQQRYGQDVFVTFVRTHTKYQRYCYDPANDDISLATYSTFWVPLVTQQTVVPDLYAHIADYLKAPNVSWPSMDKEFGWLYVKAPMDFRIDPVPSIELTASVTNVTGTVTATVSATPTELQFEPGEPGSGVTACPINAATAPYSASTPGACSYDYSNSSAISPTGRFPALASIVWVIETSDPSFPVTQIRTWSSFDVAVAEAQAVVTG